MAIVYACLSIALAAISMPLYKTSSHRSIGNKNLLSQNSHPRELFLSFNVSNYNDYVYYTKVSIGTPPQQFLFIIDTTSAWTWIPWNQCRRCHTYGDKFIKKNSTTYLNTTEVKRIKYFDGYLSTDTFSIGDSDSLVLADLPFILVYDEKQENLNMWQDGVLGFAFDERSAGATSIMTSLKNKGKIQSKQFALYLSEANVNSKMGGLGSSSFILDGYDLEKYSSESAFTYIDLVNSNGLWEIKCDKVEYSGVEYNKGKTAVLWTGSSEIVGPEDDMRSILAYLFSSPDCQYKDTYKGTYCKCNGTFPSLTFTFSGYPFTLEPSDYFYIDDGNCYPNFNSIKLDHWILGSSFLRRFYINFDMDGRRVGFAKIKLVPQEEDNNDSSSGGTADWKIAIIVVLSIFGGLWIIIVGTLLLMYLVKIHVVSKDEKPTAENSSCIKEMAKTISSASSADASNNRYEERKDTENEKREGKKSDKTAGIINYPKLEEVNIIVECN